MATSAKKGAQKDDANFRARRLSVSDIDTSEFEKANAATPDRPGGSRVRRMSMSPEMGVVKKKDSLPFPLEFVGTYSCHGVEPGMRQGETSAKINQDRGCVCYPFGMEGNVPYQQALFCVYDGHGALGDRVSHFVMNKIQEELESNPKLNDNPAAALKETFNKVDKDLQADKAIDAELSGTTAVVILYRELSDTSVVCWSACCGDSRATMCQLKKGAAKKRPETQLKDAESKDLTVDQKPDTEDEAKRIKSKGGFISPPEEEWGGPARVWLDANMTLPGLAMARSIGDHLVSSVGVIAEPEVKKFEFGILPDDPTEDGPAFIVMASDGVWEFIESDDACALVHKFLYKKEDGCQDATVAVTKLIETAAAKWRQEEGDYRDDITAIVVRMRGLFQAAKAGARGVAG